ncbi:MAG: N-acetylmuramoyl-L-alanine amidase [Clostridium sp.]|nr:N-acetylmuramoyl-L-alanine amidase [Clostridium sp.]
MLSKQAVCNQVLSLEGASAQITSTERISKEIFSAVMGVLLVVSMLFVGREAAVYVGSQNVVAEDPRPCVVVDAGHGGMDPGKVGINGALEKDLNLEIARLVRMFLEADDIRVVMTREADGGLYGTGASNKKVQDMKQRIALITETQPNVAVSIHQNSYTEEYVRGAQVFYYTGSKEGQALAESIQKRMVATLDPGNSRQVKGNDSYYLLKKTDTPIVIVECGFLSNQEESRKLCDPLYQEKVAWAIHLGIIQYLNSRD